MSVNFLKAAVFSLLSLMTSGLEVETRQKAPLAGTWIDNQGGVIVIRHQGRFLDVSGKDAYSIYTSVCLLSADEITANCLGEGIQVESGRRFLYRSYWQIQNGTIEEKWEAHLADEELRGTLHFKRPSH